MKKLCLLLLLSFAASVRAENPQALTPSQTNYATPAKETVQAPATPQQDQKLTTQIELRARETPLYIEKPAPNEMSLGRLKVDGIVVHLIRTDNPLQLINPAAPERHGSPEDNVVRDLTTGKVSGLKLLELRF
jgi:hypothetical protein